MAKPIKIKFQNGINSAIAYRDILNELAGHFTFEESNQPDFIIFGPYGNDIPVPGSYTRIGYFCENIKPDMSICEWAFGVPREEDVRHPRYKRIQWHGLDPNMLIKPSGYDPGKILASKTKFCNFLYSHDVPYREAFFKTLSKYKKVDAPGKSMNNMPGIDTFYTGSRWEVKRQFLSEYKFTIAFENDIYPGYQTEKLYDPMVADSVPIYCGDPFVGDIFNIKSFVNVDDYLPKKNIALLNQLERSGQMDFDDIRPMYLKDPKHRIKRKVKSLMRTAKINLQFANRDFRNVIEQIVAIDSKPELYLEYLGQPWLKNNTIPVSLSSKSRWIEIFNSAK
jgi:hypothetical protein